MSTSYDLRLSLWERVAGIVFGFLILFLIVPSVFGYHQFWPDIIGSLLGFLGAISLEQYFLTKREQETMESYLQELLRDVTRVARDMATGDHYYIIPPTRWNALKSTRFSELIPPEHYEKFELLEVLIEHHNTLVKELMAADVRHEIEDRMYQVFDVNDEQGYEVSMVILDDYYSDPKREDQLNEIRESYKKRYRLRRR